MADVDFPESTLSEEASRARRNLIAVTSVWILIVPLGLAPKKILIFDIDLTGLSFPVENIFSVALLYFWVSFIVYAYKDWVPWKSDGREKIRVYKKKLERQKFNKKKIEDYIRKTDPQNIGSTVEIESMNDDNQVSILKYPGANIGERPPELKKTIGQFLTEKRQLQFDYYSRSVWDYIFPFLIVSLPIYDLFLSSFLDRFLKVIPSGGG
ncbi:MAG TPA: hypothetical protein QGG18_05610 [Rhodospirillales bacterium]|nr:hypothetical protein [Rhodospirillales bacterium]